MKNYLYLLFICVAVLANAQNVGINNTDPQAALDLSGDLRLRTANLKLQAAINHNVILDEYGNGVVYHFIGDAVANGGAITGFQANKDGRIITIFNNCLTANIVLHDESNPISLGSDKKYRILTGSGDSAVIYRNGSVTLRYDGGKERWTVVSSNNVDGLSTLSNTWNTLGNAGTTTNSFIGTTDGKPLRIRINNVSSGIIDSIYQSTALGYKALKNNTNGQSNTAFGYEAMIENTIGANNSAFGVNALSNNSTGNNNTAIGPAALYSNVTGSENVGIGFQALASNEGSSNVAVGNQSLLSNTTGKNNVAIGDNSLSNSMVINSLVAIGDSAMYKSTNGEQNTAIGSKALYNNISGDFNTAVGYLSLKENTGSNNTAVGRATLFLNSTGENSTAVGTDAMILNTTGSINTAVGSNALRQNTFGYSNTALGASSLYTNTTGYDNTAIGTGTLNSNVGGNANVAVGRNALASNISGSSNIAIGPGTLYKNVISNYQVAIGDSALHNFRTTDNFIGRNIALGAFSSYSNIAGDDNIALGYNSLSENLFGNRNIAIGNGALQHMGFDLPINSQYANDNIAIGTGSQRSGAEGRKNTTLGHLSLNTNLYGINNTAVGANALFLNRGSANIGIGVSAGSESSDAARDVNNTITIGNNVSTNVSNHVLIGNPLHAGNYYIWGSGWGTASDERVKNSVKDDVQGLSFIKKLRPVTYHYDVDKICELANQRPETLFAEAKNRSNNRVFTGFIAQEVAQAAKECDFNFSGVTAPVEGWDIYTLNYTDFIMPMVKAIQEQQLQIEDMKKYIDSAKSEIPKQQLIINAQNKKIEVLEAALISIKDKLDIK
jgi:hypothetical protein